MAIDTAQVTVNGYRANLGAIQNRMISTQSNLGVSIENLSAANSRIRDADVAQSTADLTKNSFSCGFNFGIAASKPSTSSSFETDWLIYSRIKFVDYWKGLLSLSVPPPGDKTPGYLLDIDWTNISRRDQHSVLLALLTCSIYVLN